MADTVLAQTILGDSAAMRKLRGLIVRIAPKKLPVLVNGPTGSGKELVAHALHLASGRKGRFVPFNVCAAPETMFEDALFGHVRGAFTGAAADAPGYMAEADGGTLFLDEISGLGTAQQTKLLRAIETRQFRPVGASRDRRSEFRVVAASNEDLSALAADGRFRADLLHRLDGITLMVPSLAERKEDIPLLLCHFLRTIVPGLEPRVTPAGLRVLQEYDWPGNVRELRNVAERAVLLAEDAVLGHEEIARAMPGNVGTDGKTCGRESARQHLLGVLEGCGWKPHRAADVLQVHWTTVYRRMRELGIRRPRGTVSMEQAAAAEGSPSRRWKSLGPSAN